MFLNTKGSGLWSSDKKKVKITHIELGYFDDFNFQFGELRVYFDPKTWNLSEDGLIYTDPQFLRELKEYLKNQGLSSAKIEYSEQGMQGDDYVSLDIYKDFLKSWASKFGLLLPSPNLTEEMYNTNLVFGKSAKAKKKAKKKTKSKSSATA